MTTAQEICGAINAEVPDAECSVTVTDEHVIDLGENRGTVVWSYDGAGWSATRYAADPVYEIVEQDGGADTVGMVASLVRMARAAARDDDGRHSGRSE